MSKIIGIDLGTTNSLVAVMEGNKPVIIPTHTGSLLFKSAVRFLIDGQCTAGDAAFRARLADPENTVTSIKRLMGRKYSEIFDLAQRTPYCVASGQNNLASVECHGKYYTPQEISALILRELKACAEQYLGTSVNEAIITVPAYFNDLQKSATREAGELAGLRVRRIINEPTAAAMSYGLMRSHEDLKIVVFDLGGGTFDVSILELGDGVFEVKAISGDGFLGGDDFDQAIEHWLINEIELQYGVQLSAEAGAVAMIKEAALRAKIELSSTDATTITIPYLPTKRHAIQHIEIELTRHRFEEMCEELFERLIHPCLEALTNAGLDPQDIDRVIMVGGATRMPRVKTIIWDIFKALPFQNINPDEAIALGAAIQGGVFTGEVKDVLLLDVIARPLGIETADGRMLKIIDSNTTTPTKVSETFKTAYDNQTSVEIHVLEGENELAIGNKSLGRLVLDQLSPAPAGAVTIEVALDIDANHILHVNATDRTTGKGSRLRIEQKAGLTEEQFLQKLPDQRGY